MAKNLLIFSDGTGQAGGLLPDENRSNVYKLFKATRCGPDSAVDPSLQLAFYDPGLGTASDGADIQIGFFRHIYNVLSLATGLGITKNIIDCYADIVQHYEPGDRIYLFGFSRGAYTVRCVGGVISNCGLPTQNPDGSSLKRDSKTARAIAQEAVKSVYQHGAGLDRHDLELQRNELASNFRKRYASSNAMNESNDVPYFIGVWDTVAALGVTILQQVFVGSITVVFVAAISALMWWIFSIPMPLASWIMCSIGGVVVLAVIWYFVTHLKWATGLSVPWWKTLHLTRWRMKFYNENLNGRTSYAKHALAIDENRESFQRVLWSDQGVPSDGRPDDWFEQTWFAGVHSDIGGSYPETESRLSDISLDWMVNRATEIPHPVIVDRTNLHMFPSCMGVQHDERKRSRLPYRRGVRKISDTAVLHPTVIERFKLPSVVHFDDVMPYRPENLRHHKDVSEFYKNPQSHSPFRNAANLSL